jgi:hypothetical protein
MVMSVASQVLVYCILVFVTVVAQDETTNQEHTIIKLRRKLEEAAKTAGVHNTRLLHTYGGYSHTHSPLPAMDYDNNKALGKKMPPGSLYCGWYPPYTGVQAHDGFGLCITLDSSSKQIGSEQKDCGAVTRTQHWCEFSPIYFQQKSFKEERAGTYSDGGAQKPNPKFPKGDCRNPILCTENPSGSATPGAYYRCPTWDRTQTVKLEMCDNITYNSNSCGNDSIDPPSSACTFGKRPTAFSPCNAKYTCFQSCVEVRFDTWRANDNNKNFACTSCNMPNWVNDGFTQVDNSRQVNPSRFGTACDNEPLFQPTAAPTEKPTTAVPTKTTTKPTAAPTTTKPTAAPTPTTRTTGLDNGMSSVSVAGITVSVVGVGFFGYWLYRKNR